MSAPSPGPSDPDRRYGLQLLNELIRVASSEGDVPTARRRSSIACCLLGRTDPRTWRPATSTIGFAEWVLYRDR